MFDIKIGTIIDAYSSDECFKYLNEKGFESYELSFGPDSAPEDMSALAEKVRGLIGERAIGALGLYGNTLKEDDVFQGIKNLIVNAHRFGTDVVAMFAGSDTGKPVPESIPLFKEKFSVLIDLAEKYDVRLAIENCGGNWQSCRSNIGFCSEAWDLMFDAVPSDRLGLEWEPAHQLCNLVDVEAQLRRYAKKVFHVHGKDATIFRDVLAQYGLGNGNHEWRFHRTPGFGDSNWSNLFTILLMNGFEGSCDIEGYHDPVHYEDMEWSSQIASLDYLKRCRGGLEFYDEEFLPHGYQHGRKAKK